MRNVAARLSGGQKKHLIGVSGGRDSLALLHALAAAGWNNLIVCHLHHGLRGADAGRDAALVRRTAARLELPFETARADTNAFARQWGLSTEHAARELRHAFFEVCARKHRCRRVLLAHHADDQVETILFQFFRGSGAAGLSGMKPVSVLGRLTLLRPLLTVSRAEVDAYVRRRGIRYREDTSNASSGPTRNRLRHQVMPVIEQAVGPHFREAILRAGTILEEEDAFLESLLPEPAEELRRAELRALPLALRRRLVLRWLRRRGVTGAGFAEVGRVLSLLDPESGPAKINLPDGRHARRRAGRIFLE